MSEETAAIVNNEETIKEYANKELEVIEEDKQTSIGEEEEEFGKDTLVFDRGNVFIVHDEDTFVYDGSSRDISEDIPKPLFKESSFNLQHDPNFAFKSDSKDHRLPKASMGMIPYTAINTESDLQVEDVHLNPMEIDMRMGRIYSLIDRTQRFTYNRYRDDIIADYYKDLLLSNNVIVCNSKHIDDFEKYRARVNDTSSLYDRYGKETKNIVIVIDIDNETEGKDLTIVVFDCLRKLPLKSNERVIICFNIFGDARFDDAMFDVKRFINIEVDVQRQIEVANEQVCEEEEIQHIVVQAEQEKSEEQTKEETDEQVICNEDEQTNTEGNDNTEEQPKEETNGNEDEQPKEDDSEQTNVVDVPFEEGIILREKANDTVRELVNKTRERPPIDVPKCTDIKYRTGVLQYGTPKCTDADILYSLLPFGEPKCESPTELVNKPRNLPSVDVPAYDIETSGEELLITDRLPVKIPEYDIITSGEKVIVREKQNKPPQPEKKPDELPGGVTYSSSQINILFEHVRGPATPKLAYTFMHTEFDIISDMQLQEYFHTWLDVQRADIFRINRCSLYSPFECSEW